MSAAGAFYEPAGDGYRSTELTRGPWDPESQHAGPPSALIAREIERCPGGEEAGPRTVGRITLEILRPVPIAELSVSAEVIRPGRRVDLVEATLSDTDGRPLIRARAWRLAPAALELPAGLASTDEGSAARRAGRRGGGSDPIPPPAEVEPNERFFPTGHELGYHAAMDVRFVSGGFLEPGPAVAWFGMKTALVAGEEPTALQRVMAAGDSGNGISSALDFREYLFVNVDLTVHLHRMPEGEWVCLDALTIPEPSGVGLSDAMLLDERGPIGRACQTLLVAPR